MLKKNEGEKNELQAYQTAGESLSHDEEVVEESDEDVMEENLGDSSDSLEVVSECSDSSDDTIIFQCLSRSMQEKSLNSERVRKHLKACECGNPKDCEKCRQRVSKERRDKYPSMKPVRCTHGQTFCYQCNFINREAKRDENAVDGKEYKLLAKLFRSRKKKEAEEEQAREVALQRIKKKRESNRMRQQKHRNKVKASHQSLQNRNGRRYSKLPTYLTLKKSEMNTH